MSIASEITRLQNIKTNIRSALVTQGVPAASSHDMADFSADILSISTGGGATITVTYSSDFYGSTITATNGSKTVTKVAPSTGSAEIKVSEEGIWTISAPAQGQTFSTTTTVVLDYTAQLTAIPDGSTATPTDIIQTWLHCAEIFDKNYTTIAQVLADTTSLLTLISDNNACDYMARSTSWATDVCSDSTAMTYIGNNDYCAEALLSDSTWASAICNSTYFESVLNVKVPTMTSNTTPSGQCFGSSIDGSAYNYFRAFDNSSNGWGPTGTDSWGVANCGYKFTQSTIISKWGIKEVDNAYNRVYRLEGSNDGVTYTPIVTSDAITAANVWYYFETDDTTQYDYYRCVMVSGSNTPNYGHGKKFQFYGRTS